VKAVAGVSERIKRRACTAKLARLLRRAGDSRSASPDGVTKTMHMQRQFRDELEGTAGRDTMCSPHDRLWDLKY
jgi:hypothetical protein